MNGEALLKALLAALACLALWLRDRGVLDTAEANLAAANLRSTRDEIGRARAARNAGVGDLERDPKRLHDDDGFKRAD